MAEKEYFLLKYKEDLEKQRQEDQSRALYYITDIAEERYKEYKRLDFEGEKVLFIGDFRPSVNARKRSQNLELMLPSERFETVEYSRVLKRLIRIFDMDRDSNDFNTGHGSAIPIEKSNNLDKFRMEHPGFKLKTEYMCFNLVSPKDEHRMIVRQRYIDSNNSPLTEVWTAIKYKTG